MAKSKNSFVVVKRIERIGDELQESIITMHLDEYNAKISDSVYVEQKKRSNVQKPDIDLTKLGEFDTREELKAFYDKMAGKVVEPEGEDEPKPVKGKGKKVVEPEGEVTPDPNAKTE